MLIVAGIGGLISIPATAVACGGVLGIGVGMIEVAVPALCERAGAPSATGFVFGLWGLGSLIGGAVASRMDAGPDPGRRVIVLLVALAGGTLPLVLAADVASLAALIFLAGIAIAPALAAVHSLAGKLATRGTITEAYTWLGTGMGAGIAVGAALGGAVVEGSGSHAAFALSAAALGIAAAVAGTRRASLRPLA